MVARNDLKAKEAEKAQKRFVLVKERPVFTGYMKPLGWLLAEHEDQYLACHALFRYYLSARQIYETESDNLLAYEGEQDSSISYAGLFKGIANWYDVEYEIMAKFWPNVDMQCSLLGLPKMPEGDRYRFNQVVEIKTNVEET